MLTTTQMLNMTTMAMGMRKKITFHSVMPQFDIPKPVPASRFVPEWYRKMNGVNSGIMTVKKCVPFLDSMTQGYVITLPVDVIWDSKNKKFLTQAKFDVNADHHPEQVLGVDIGEEYDRQPHKWVNLWHVKTPKGYSTLFVHPLNRTDLPFHSFSGIVDTDTHPLVVNFPFVLKKDFDGLIPAGTPIMQVIPFKRDDWDAKVIDTGKPHEGNSRSWEVLSPPFGWYKRNWWKRKNFS